MTLMLAVGIPVFLIMGGALLAFAFAQSPEEEAPAQQAAAEAAEAPTAEGKALVFFQPTGWSASAKPASVEDVVASIEAHLRAERKAAAAFVENPAAHLPRD
jgi:hypothetical protein